jgi:hypothetical protein
MPRWDSNPQSQQASGRRHALDRAATGTGSSFTVTGCKIHTYVNCISLQIYISSREVATKVHSLFSAWYAPKLTSNRSFFMNVTYRIFSNLIRTSFCRFLKKKKVSSRFQSAPFLQLPLAYKADWLNNIACCRFSYEWWRRVWWIINYKCYIVL